MADKLAIVTGASSGIGLELARIAAADGYDLIIAADEAMDHVVSDLTASGVNVEAVVADLAELEGVDRVLDAARGRRIDVVCANAGTGTGGAFLDQSTTLWRHSIDTNITGTVYLLQRTLAAMVARNGGRILVTGSIAGYIPGAFNAVYNATKAFVDNFTDALRNEIKDSEVTLTTLLPGATDTEFFDRAGMEDTNVGRADKDDPAKVARDGWKALMAGKARITSGLHNKLQVAAAGLAPPALLAEMHRGLAEPSDDE
ncbi:MAG: SDR family NAD(P)-dependent oxidoreductase [Sphingomonas sp.]|nr:SDR family NAD(P)-dependent oxidoreductase [Sphingomonas sp.]